MSGGGVEGCCAGIQHAGLQVTWGSDWLEVMRWGYKLEGHCPRWHFDMSGFLYDCESFLFTLGFQHPLRLLVLCLLAFK